jgi:hypothetical protein
MPFVVVACLLILTLAVNLGGSALTVSARASQFADVPWQIQTTQTTQASEIQALQTALAEPTGTPRPASMSVVSPAATVQPGTGSLPQKLLPVVESLHPYKNSSKEEFTVSNLDAKASATRLHLARLDLEDGVDWLIIMDGQDVEMQRLTGVFPEGVWTDFVPGNLVRLRLVSDGSVSTWGFAADAVESATFASLAYSAHPYPNYSKQTWPFNNLDAEAEATRLHFSRLDLEKDVDWLVVMDLTETPYQWITGQYTQGLWSKAVPGTGILLKLVSDSSVNGWGFNVAALESARAEKPDAPPESDQSLAESKHPFADGRASWTLVNPDPTASFTKVHFARIDIVNGTLGITDGNGNAVQAFGDRTSLKDHWSEDVPGRVVKIYLDGRYDKGWGFRIDRLVSGIPQPAHTESKHPFVDGRATWTIVNPDPGAAYTKVHFAKLHIANGTLGIMDANGNAVQAFGDRTYLADYWSEDIPGRVVKIYLDGRYDKGWGFRIDRLVSSIPQAPLAESKHPFEDGGATWLVTNPNPAALYTRLHFARLHITNGRLVLMDGNDKEIQTYGDRTYLEDHWSDKVPGRVVKIRLEGRYDKGWGFRIDDVAPKVEEKPLPAFVNAVYMHVGQPGTVWLNGTRLWQATQPGDYLVRLPELGENAIKVETLFHEQKINVTTARDGGVRIEYSGVQSKPAPTATVTK